MLLVPATVLTLLLVAFNLLGNGLRARTEDAR
jgi:ABC-type dipeptide/oligopeptide/nickel transport system permease subunit